MENLAMTRDGAALFACVTIVPALLGIASAEFAMWRSRRKARQSGQNTEG